MKRAGFTLVELLLVVGVLVILVGILTPVLAAAWESAKVVKVNAELRQIGIALDLYAENHHGMVPPARTYCEREKAEQWCELPVELVRAGCLPAGSPDGLLSSAMEDVFNPGHTYKYLAPGWGFHNNGVVPKALWVPDQFPHDDPQADPQTLPGKSYDNVNRPRSAQGLTLPSPVKWVVWSLGPRYGDDIQRAPVARCSWYRGYGTRGVIPRICPMQGEPIVPY